MFDNEPLPDDHPLRRLTSALVTPHIGYVAENLDRTFFQDTADNVASWLSPAGHAN